MLLHSGFADHPHNRFDILRLPRAPMLLTRGEQIGSTTAKPLLSQQDPLQLLQQQLDRQPFTPQPHDDPPLFGGAGIIRLRPWAVALSVSLHAQADIALADMAVGDLATGRLSSTTSANRYRCSAMTTRSSVYRVEAANADAG
ncbi:hypothetical protein MJ561_18530 [Klebsiella pneumoniae]|nr:hypothetical protein MJ561_18530 [Klebsiella pneumoniae]